MAYQHTFVVVLLLCTFIPSWIIDFKNTYIFKNYENNSSHSMQIHFHNLNSFLLQLNWNIYCKCATICYKKKKIKRGRNKIINMYLRKKTPYFIFQQWSIPTIQYALFENSSVQHHQQCLPKHYDYGKLFQGVCIYCACRSALAVRRMPPNSQIKEKKNYKCDISIGKTVW